MLTETRQILGSAGPAVAQGSGDFSEGAEKFAVGRILVVDDEALIRWSVAEMLQLAGYAVVVTDDAASARRCLREGPPFDAVLLDLELPDSGDLGLLRTVRAMAPDTPVVLMSAFLSDEIEEQAYRFGAASVLKKPFDLGGLVALVDILGRSDRAHHPGR
jgi:DNA-binding NtrC family response regulator